MSSKTAKVVGTVTPKEPPEQWKATWYLSTGDELMIRWETSTSLSDLGFNLRCQAAESSVGWDFLESIYVYKS